MHQTLRRGIHISAEAFLTACWIMTGFKLMVTLQSGCVIEILTLCRIDVIFFKKYHVKALEQSFPMMYNTI